MKVLLVNKFHYRRGGAETAYFDLAELLESAGDQVVPFAMEHPGNAATPYAGDFVSRVELRGRAGAAARLRTAGRVLWSREAARKIAAVVARERPDLAHLHNVYHHLSPSILGPLRRAGVPVVMTLHDYKVVCPAYQMVSRGAPCDRCRDGRFRHALLRRCGGGGAAESALLAAEAALHGKLLRSYDRVDLFLSPSRFLADAVRRMGFRGELRVVPNAFFPARFRPSFDGDPRLVLYAGRLAREKGVLTLVRAMAGVDARLEIAGDGPERAALEAEARAAGSTGVSFLGHLSRERLAEKAGAAGLIVVPSEWPENSPYAVLEAFALGKPVLGARAGGIPELVRDGATGRTFPPGDEAALRRTLTEMIADPGRLRDMGRRARAEVEARFAPDRVLPLLREAYARAAAKAAARRPGAGAPAAEARS